MIALQSQIAILRQWPDLARQGLPLVAPNAAEAAIRADHSITVADRASTLIGMSLSSQRLTTGRNCGEMAKISGGRFGGNCYCNFHL